MEACPICLDDFKYNSPNSVYTTACNHTFCVKCITKHLSLSESCPLCRAPVKLVQLRRLPDSSTVVLIHLKHARVTYEVFVERSVSASSLQKLLTDLLYLSPGHTTLVHQGRKLTANSFIPFSRALSAWPSGSIQEKTNQNGMERKLVSGDARPKPAATVLLVGGVPGSQKWGYGFFWIYLRFI